MYTTQPSIFVQQSPTPFQACLLLVLYNCILSGLQSKYNKNYTNKLSKDDYSEEILVSSSTLKATENWHGKGDL
jgi:hypothetical protein